MYDDWLIVECNDVSCEEELSTPNPVVDGTETEVELRDGWLFLLGLYYCPAHRSGQTCVRLDRVAPSRR